MSYAVSAWMRGAAATDGHQPLFDDLRDMTPAPRNEESYEMSSLSEEHMTDISDGWTFIRIRGRHNIFLSHSGAQKNFVEQLYEDLKLKTKLSPFFDKCPDSLPKGVEFAPLILSAAAKSEVAVVVISDDYFCRSQWPMLELVTVAQAPRCRILPLFYKLTYKEFKKEKRRERWFKQWNEWAKSDNRINVDTWKEALRKLGRVNGIQFKKALGEVSYRKEVVERLCSMMQLSSQDEIIDLEECISQGNQNPAQHPRADAGQFQCWSPVVLKSSMIICFPFWFAALLKLVMIKIMILIVLLYIGLFKFILPLVGPYFCWNQKLEPPDSKCWLSLE